MITIVARPAVPAYYFCDVDMSAVEKLRSRLEAAGTKVTVTAILLKAVAIAQLEYPESRSFRLPWGTVITIPEPTAGFTVERLVDNDPAVFFGTIKEPITKPLEQIAKELKLYSQSPISEVDQLHREDLLRRVPWAIRQISLWFALRCPPIRRLVNPASFGLSSLGKFGLKALLSPCVTTCIVGVGAMEPRAVVSSNQVVVKPMLTLTLSFDTMVLDMLKAAAFFAAIKHLLESGLEGYESMHQNDDSHAVPK